MRFRVLPAAIAAAILSASPAFGWGVAGHEIVAAVALDRLTPRARAQVGRLLGSPVMLIHDANWADEIRDQRPETGPWHYVDVPLEAPGYDRRRDCADGGCVVAQIERDLAVLSDRGAGDRRRAEALRFLIHLVADIHQPLHAEDDGDRGGNQVRVRLGRYRASLHRIWDNEVVQPLDVADVAAAFTPAQARDWSSGTPSRWANESHAIAREHIYPPLMGAREVRLPRDYVRREAPLVRSLLAKAGLRLAWLLNTNLK